MNRTIYTFWEPSHTMHPYIQLCMEKWDPFIGGFDHVLLDYSNLFEHIPKELLDLTQLRSINPALQKDIIQSAVLKYNGGIFMDADMIITQPLEKVMDLLNRYEVVTFSSHLAFMMARKEAKLTNCWFDEVRKKLDQLDEDIKVRWDHFGNSILDRWLKDHSFKAFKIDKYKAAFTPELNHFKNRGDVTDNYLKFWFSEDRSLEDVFYKDQILIALHNSWTPAWYQNLSRTEILEHPCLLSQLLRSDIRSIIPDNPRDLTLKRHIHIVVNAKIKGLKRRIDKWMRH